MPLFNIEALHRIRYERQIEAENAEQAEQIAEEMWMEFQKQYIVDEDHEVGVYPVEDETAQADLSKNLGETS